MKIKSNVAVLFVILAILLTGCSEQQQIHQKLIVQGIGVDFSETGYTITVQALDFQNPAGEEEPSTKILEITGGSLVEALENIPKQTSLNPIYSQNLIVVISEDVARSGINNFIDFFVRHCEARPKVKMCVVSGKASWILNLAVGKKPFKAKNIHDLIPNDLNSDILHFVSNLKSNISDSYLAWIETTQKPEGENVRLKGVSIFCGDCLSDLLQGDEAFGFMLLKGVSEYGACTVSDYKGGEVTCAVNKVFPRICVNIQNDIPCFTIDLDIEISVFSTNKKLDSYFDEKDKDIIEKNFSKKVDALCRAAIEKTVFKGNDVLNFGRILKNSNPKYFRAINRSWKSKIQECDYSLRQNINISITGKEPL